MYNTGLMRILRLLYNHNRSLANSLVLLGLVLNAPEHALASPSSSLHTTSLLLQRAQFLAAEKALQNQQFGVYREIAQHLDGYPLQSYLQYNELRRRLYLFPYRDVDQFLDEHADTYIGDLLAREWLETLAQKRRWLDYQKYFANADLNSAELRCFFLRARFNTGDEEVLEETAALWNVGHSQPEACDPLFKVWMDRGYLSETIAWERHSKAIAAGASSLSRYIARKMPADLRQLANLYYEVDRYPDRLENQGRFSQQSPRMHEIVLHGIRRYAQRDPLRALAQWERYDAAHYFPAEDRNRTLEYLITHLAVEGHMGPAHELLKQSEKIASAKIVAWLVRDALRSQDWQRAYDAIQLFPQEQQQSERWLYWRARALEQLDIEDPEPTAEQIYARLSLNRGFYGFLAADVLGREYSLIDRPVNPPTTALQALKNSAGIRRAKELLDLGRVVEARREWFYATRGLQPEQLLAAGKLAEQWGWYRKGIQAMAEARHWDDLQVRFPLAYLDEMNRASTSTNIEATFLYAITRQESAFAADAKSPSGAMGLMQLMPATAKRTAREIGMKYHYWGLIDPSQNIQLGSSYLNELLSQFNGNRVLAAAAYNAGPYRVKQWLEDGDRQLPYDIWIETIPYWETRGYVQNVLSYSVIYGYRMGKNLPMLGDENSRGISLANIASE